MKPIMDIMVEYDRYSGSSALEVVSQRPDRKPGVSWTRR